MLEPLKNLPPGVDGVRATGRVTKDDYERVFLPLLEGAHREGRRVRLVYQFVPEFQGFTPGAGFEDIRLGLKYLRLFERWAVVADQTWIREGVRLLGTMMPCPVKVFGNDEFRAAIAWAGAPVDGTVPHRLLSDIGVLVVEPTRPLRAEDFDAIALTVDPWIEAQGRLRGIVVHTRGFPGWQNAGSLLRHINFVREHHRNVGRVALAADGKVAELAPRLAESFVNAEVRQFEYDRLDDAISWAKAAPAAA